jgi:hypothetical protein
MPIVNPQVVRFSNEKVRTIADRFVSAYYALLDTQATYTANGIAALINAEGASGTIEDGSAVDGRSRITGIAVINNNAALTQLKTALDTTLIPGVGTSVMALLNTIQVNGSPK